MSIVMGKGAGNILMETYAVPFYQDGQFKGVATIDIPLDKLQEYMANKYLQDKPFIIVSAEGKFISHPLPEMIMHKTIQQRAKETSDLNLVKLSENLLNKKSGVIRVERLDILSDQPFWIYYAPIQSTGWSFAAATPEVEILEFLNKQTTRGIFGVFILLLLVIASILLVSTRITRPLTSLAKFAAKVGEGNLSAEIKNINTKDEIGKLANTFNHMVQQLRDHINARTREAAAREATESEMRIAKEIQASLLPDEFPPFPENDEFDLYAVNATAKQVGGDFFDYFFIDNDKLLLVIGDVSGKGTPAAIVMAVVRTLIRDLARNTSSPAEILTETNCLLVEIQKHPVFITIFLAIYEVKTGRIKYVNAGHQPPYVLNSKGEIEKFGETTGTIVGMLDDAVYKECEATLQKNDYLIAYTDGIPDARTPDGHFFGEEHFINLLKSCANLTVKEICENVINEVTAFQAKHLADDITLLILKHCE
jgi:sigma-B regulation protein RsbU (phosphoserine phosphatase)